MATSTFRNKNKVRPKKTGTAKRHRLMEHRKRLIALGVSEEKIRKMTTKDIRIMLGRPAKIKQDS